MKQAGSACLSASLPPIPTKTHAEANLHLQGFKMMYTNHVTTAPAVS